MCIYVCDIFVSYILKFYKYILGFRDIKCPSKWQLKRKNDAAIEVDSDFNPDI